MLQSIKKNFRKYFLQNLGLLNLFGKSFGRVLYLILTAYFSYKLSINHFAEFAIFWSTLRMFSFYGSNNLYIINFNKARKNLTEHKKWPIQLTSNLVFTSAFFCLLLSIISLILFEELYITVLLIASLICFLIIRNISEFSKVDNNLFLSIFIDDFLFYALFFILSIIGLNYSNTILSVLFALVGASLITAVIGLILFFKKFDLKPTSYQLSISDFSFIEFKLGLNYTFLRGNEVLSNFSVRYLGQVYFGDLFVAYTHIMYQFYNIFCLLTMSVVSGVQSKITVKSQNEFDKAFFNRSYLKIQRTVLPFVGLLALILALTNNYILQLFFPKYVSYSDLLIKIVCVGIIFAFIQPFIFILVYNNRFLNIIKLNIAQYSVMVVLFTLPLIAPGLGEVFWFLLVMVSLTIVQGLFAWLNYKNI